MSFMNWKLALFLTLLSTPGIISISWLALPLLVEAQALPVPLTTVQIVTAAQGIFLTSLAAVLGALLGGKVGLHAPVIAAMISGAGALEALRPRLLPGLIGGAIGAVIIVTLYAFSPDALTTVQSKVSIPILARVLYGGVTEEVLIRWGLMTCLVWVGWRVFQGGVGQASGTVLWLAIGLSAVLFGLSHVPSVAVLMATVPLSVAVYITVGNAVFGIVAGYLFWRYGLEAAITAHVLAHLLAYVIRG